VEGSGQGERRGGVAGVTAALMDLMPLKAGARLRGGGLRGSDGGAVMARAASRGAELGGAAGAAGGGGGAAELGRSRR
jgi:hypothetical protein